MPDTAPTGDGTAGPAALAGALMRMGLLGEEERPRFEPLAGGVSSDIYKVETAAGPVCVKRALPKLKVAADWRAPTERNGYEAGWLVAANAVVPGAAPRLLGQDAEAGALAMTWLEPERHPVWKVELAAGRADPRFAGEVGRRLAAIHRAHANDPDTAAAFATDSIFHAIRLEPYLLATAEMHPDVGPALTRLATATASRRETLVHGDVSPKNILVGPDGPVFLDAECAWYGDPAFDIAFCLNHMLLKSVWKPRNEAAYLACFAALVDGYAPDPDLETRAARLLPGLLLARLDGKSPVEYLTLENERTVPRAFARRLLIDPLQRLGEIIAAWIRRENL